MSKFAIGPTAALLTASDLPKTKNVRWVPRRKAEVVLAISSGVITEDDALRLYGLSRDELSGWRRRYSAGGLPALRQGA